MLTPEEYDRNIALNTRKLLRNSRIYSSKSKEKCVSEEKGKHVKNWIELNKKEFLIKKITPHRRTASLDM